MHTVHAGRRTDSSVSVPTPTVFDTFETDVEAGIQTCERAMEVHIHLDDECDSVEYCGFLDVFAGGGAGGEASFV